MSYSKVILEGFVGTVDEIKEYSEGKAALFRAGSKLTNPENRNKCIHDAEVDRLSENDKK